MEAVLIYLSSHFEDLMNLHLTVSIVILFVICVRELMKGAPKIFSYALWGIVLLRLLIPVSIESPVSLVPERTEFSSMVEVNEVLPEIQFETLQDRAQNQYIRENTPSDQPYAQVSRSLDAETYLTLAWLLGIAVMLVRSVISYWKLKRKLKVVVPYRKGIYLADDIDTPFVMGFFRPKIYLPGSLEPWERTFIIAHEKHHIRRGDHIFKALGFLALTIHWFNPLVWVAFAMAGRDMEMSCDEAVIRKLGEDVRAEYSASLLNLATGHRLFAGTPLAFGEGDPAGRVRNLAKWKKPAIWIIVICIVVCAILAVCLLTDPEIENPFEMATEPAETVKVVLSNDPLPEGYFEGSDEDGNTIFTDGDNTIGGVICYRIPEGIYDPEEHIEILLYRMGIPDYIDASLYYRGGMTSGDTGWLAEFESETEEGEEPEIYRRHHFYPVGDVVYDIWFDMTQVDYETAEAIRVCVNIPADSVTIGIGDLYFALPEGFDVLRKESEVYSEDGQNLNAHIIWKNGMVVGGIYTLKSSDPSLYVAGEWWDWLESLSVPENVPDDRFIMSVACTWEYEFEPEMVIASYGKNGSEETKHYLFNTGEEVYDIWFDMEQVSEEVNGILQTVEIHTNVWDISIQPDRVSRTGATAVFRYGAISSGEESVELSYGDDLVLEKQVDGNWIPCDELAGYDYYVGDSSYPVVDGYGMVHEWQNRFGELADGTYRMGKLVTLTRPDGSTEEEIIYGIFSIPEDIQTGLIPMEDLPEVYSSEQAMIDGCFVSTDGVARLNQESFHAFAENSWNGIPSVIRLYNCSYGDTFQWTAMDLSFDGSVYTLASLENTYTFRYLKHFAGEKAWADADHDAFEYYFLVNDDSLTWEQIRSGILDTGSWESPAHWTVYAEFSYAPKQPQLPTNLSRAELVFEGETLVSTADFDRLEKIWILFSNGEFIGYEPKTHSIGVGLDLILTTDDGQTVTIELDPDSDLCRIDGEYVFYGAADEPCYIQKLWYYLGILVWPEEVYAVCENAWRG